MGAQLWSYSNEQPALQPGKHMILRIKQVIAKTGLSRSTIYNRVKDRSLPEPINLGGNSVGWFVSDIDTYLEQCALTRRGGVL